MTSRVAAQPVVLLAVVLSAACGASRPHDRAGGGVAAGCGGASAEGAMSCSVAGVAAVGGALGGGSTQGGSASPGPGGSSGGGAGSGGTSNAGTGQTREGTRFEPGDGQTLVVIGQDTASIEEYVTDVGPFPAGVMLYTNIDALAGLESAATFGAGQHDLPYWSAREQPFVLQVGLYMVGALDDVASGNLDQNIDRMAELFAACGRPVLLRIGYEFDSDWAGYAPEDFKPAYRRIADRVRAAKADNVAFVWHSWGYHHSFEQPTAEPWYPGDDYVDWVGISFFPGWDPPSIAAAASARTELADFARARRKPLMIAEAAPREALQPALGQAAWDGWYAPLFEYVEENDVKMLSYINANWEAQPLWMGQGWGDSRVQTSALVLGSWKAKLAEARFLHSSEELYASIGF